MRLNYLYVLLFFGILALGALILFPTSLDVVTLYRNSYLYGTALRLLDELEKQNPEDEGVALEQARVLYLVGRYEKAIEILEQLTTNRPDDGQAWRQLAQTYRTVQQHRLAASAYEHLLASTPADSQALYLLEEYYRWFQQPDKRAANLKILVDAFPEDFYSREKLADLYMRMGRAEEAVETIERTARAFPDSATIQTELGQIYLARRDERALPIYLTLHERFPERQDYFDGLISAMITADRRDEVLARFEAFYTPRLNRGEYARRLGQLYLYLGDSEQAIVQLETSLEISPTIDIRLQLIDLYDRTRRYDRTVDHARQLVRQQPERADFWEIYTDYLATAEYREELVDALERYTARWPNNPRMLGELADAYEWLEDYPSVLPIAQRLFRTTSGEEVNRARLARTYYALGDYDQAAAHFDDLLRRHPGSLEYRQGMWLALEQLPADARTFSFARRLYRLTGPEHSEVGLLLARLHESREQQHSAELIYAALSRVHPDSVALHIRIGNQLLEAHHLELARAYFLRALDLAPISDDALSGLAAVAYEQNAPDALEHLKNLEQRRPERARDLVSRARATRLRAQAYLAKEAWTEAERQLTALNQRFPEDRFVLSDLATACQRLGQIDRADGIYRQLIKLYPETPSYRRDRIYLLFETERYPTVVELIDAEPEPPTGELRRLLATALDRTGQEERADQFYDAALTESPEDFDLLLMMGERQLGKGRSERALSYFEQALPLQPRNPRLLKDLALAVQEEDPEQYRQYLLPILVYDRSDAEVPYLLGEFYRPDDPQRARKYYQEGIRRLQKKVLRSTDLYHQSLEARLRYRIGERIEAENRYRDLLVRHPDATDLRDDLAQLLVEERRWDEALELIPPDSTGDRASWLRVAVHQARGDWPRLADELSILSSVLSKLILTELRSGSYS